MTSNSDQLTREIPRALRRPGASLIAQPEQLRDLARLHWTLYEHLPCPDLDQRPCVALAGHLDHGYGPRRCTIWVGPADRDSRSIHIAHARRLLAAIRSAR